MTNISGRNLVFTFLLSVLAIAFPSVSVWSASPAAPPPAPALGQAVAGVLRQERLAGATWALVEPGRTVTAAAGSFNAVTGIPMQPRHKVHIGSVTKTLLAVGLLRLASERRLDLDAPLATVLPDVEIHNPWAATHPIRIRHLLDHTAGLEDLRIAQMFSAQTGPRDPLGKAFERHPGAMRVRTRPGEMFSYSNIGYALAGLVIERVTGQRYEPWLDRNLLAPLEMRDSSFEFVSQATNPDPRLARGHNDDLSLAPALPVALRPAAQFTTTAEDMGRFARFLLSDGSVAGKPFVQPALLRAMGAPVETAAARAGLPLGYRFGLVSRDRQSRIGLCHSGNIIGYRAQLCIYPKERKAYFYSVNTDGESADYARIDKLMVEALRLPEERATLEGKPPADVRKWAGRYVPAVSGINLERYTDWLLEGVRFVPAPDHAVLVPQGADPRRLSYSGGGLLRASDRVVPSHALVRGRGGEQMITDGLRTFRRVPQLTIWGLWMSLGAGLAALAYAALALPVLTWRRRAFVVQPMVVAPLLLLAGAALFYMQPFVRLGDISPGSVLIAAGSLALPLGAAAQALVSVRRRWRFWTIDLIAALALLQWSAVIALFGLLPLVLWA